MAQYPPAGGVGGAGGGHPPLVWVPGPPGGQMVHHPPHHVMNPGYMPQYVTIPTAPGPQQPQQQQQQQTGYYSSSNPQPAYTHSPANGHPVFSHTAANGQVVYTSAPTSRQMAPNQPFTSAPVTNGPVYYPTQNSGQGIPCSPVRLHGGQTVMCSPVGNKSQMVSSVLPPSPVLPRSSSPSLASYVPPMAQPPPNTYANPAQPYVPNYPPPSNHNAAIPGHVQGQGHSTRASPGAGCTQQPSSDSNPGTPSPAASGSPNVHAPEFKPAAHSAQCPKAPWNVDPPQQPSTTNPPMAITPDIRESGTASFSSTSGAHVPGSARRGSDHGVVLFPPREGDESSPAPRAVPDKADKPRSGRTVPAEISVRDNLYRQYTDILRKTNGLDLDSPDLDHIHETLSLEERDLIENEAQGSIKTLLEQSPMFRVSENNRVELNLREYLVE